MAAPEHPEPAESPAPGFDFQDTGSGDEAADTATVALEGLLSERRALSATPAGAAAKSRARPGPKKKAAAAPKVCRTRGPV